MKRNKILNKCDSYVRLFKDEKNHEHNNFLEFLDFVNLHLPANSNLAFETNNISFQDLSEHAERIKKFIEINGSKSMPLNNNILSEKNNLELISIIFGICIPIFGIGYYFGTEKTNIELLKTENEFFRLKDSIYSVKTIDLENTMINEKNSKSYNNNDEE